MTPSDDPERGRTVQTGAFGTNVLETGQGDGVPAMLLHGSGPGVTAWANWRGNLPALARRRPVFAPDLLGFGYTDRPQGVQYNLDAWVQQVVHLMDALDLPRVDLVGNSFGGGLALALAIHAPERVRRLVLMGSVGLPFELTPGLDAVWGYTPSLDHMRALLDLFAFDRNLVTDELAQLRYEASVRPGFQEAFAAMFPAPRQRWIAAMASAEEDIRALPHEVLVVHGREDQVIPLSNALTLAHWIPRSQLHVFGRCGHWTQIEHQARFNRLVDDFFAEADAAAA